MGGVGGKFMSFCDLVKKKEIYIYIYYPWQHSSLLNIDRMNRVK